jgi:hypothetical protein
MKKICYITGFIVLSFWGYSQGTDSSKDDKSFFRSSSFQINFSTVPTQSFSSADTSYSNSFSIAPLLDLRSKSGWGISYSPAFVISGSKTGIYMHTISGGYERYGKGKTDLAFSYNHFIATNTTSVPYTSISNEVFFYTSYTSSWLHPLLSGSFGFGKDSPGGASRIATELALQAGINHSFDWDETGVFSSIEITPGLILNAGNNQYFSFLSSSKYMAHSNHLLKHIKSSGKNKKTNSPVSQLQISNMELNAEMELNAGRFSLQPEGSIFIPVGSADHTLYGYWQVGLHYSF